MALHCDTPAPDHCRVPAARLWMRHAVEAPSCPVPKAASTQILESASCATFSLGSSQEPHPAPLDASTRKRLSSPNNKFTLPSLDQNWSRSACRRVRWSSADRTRSDVALAQVALHAPTPGADKRKIHRATDCRTRQRDHPPDPLLCCFGSQLRSQPTRDLRRDLLEHLLLDEVFAVIDAGRRRSRQPQLHPVVHAALLEPIKKAKTLN